MTGFDPRCAASSSASRAIVDGLLSARAVNGQPSSLAEVAELLDGRGAVDVGGDQEGC